MSFVGGRLKLKGDPLKPSGGLKKKKKKGSKEGEGRVHVDEQDQVEGGKSERERGEKKREDHRTEAEKRRDRALAVREAERIKKLADTSYRQRVEEYNKYLSSLSEHHDIPKVGPG